MALKNRVVSGFIWTAGEKFATLAVNLGVKLVLLNYIWPEEFGLVAMLTAFSMIAYTIIDSGFSQALIRKQDAGQKDYNSIFLLNVAIAVVLYCGLVALSLPVSRFFGEPRLTSFAPVLFLTLPVSALGLIQTTIYTKRMDFRRLSAINLVSSLVSGVLVIVLAVRGMGHWAVIWQLVAIDAIRTLLLWVASPWRPSLTFSMASVRGLFGFGSRLFASGIINQVFGRLSVLVIGKLYSPGQVGLYNESLKLKDAVALAMSQSVQNVTFPALSTFQDDRTKLKTASRQLVNVLSYILFPVMAGLISVAEEGFILAGGDKWVQAIPYFRIFCLSIIFIPLTNISMNILKARGEGGLILRLEIIKKTFALLVIGAASFSGVTALVWAYVLWMGFEMAVNLLYASRQIGYVAREQAKDTVPYLIMTGIMGAVLLATHRLIGGASLMVLMGAKVAVWAAAFVILSLTMKPSGWLESREIIRTILTGKKGAH